MEYEKPVRSGKEKLKLLILVAIYLCAGLVALNSHTVLSSFERDGTEMLFDAERIYNGKGYDSDFWPFGYMASIAFIKMVTGIDYFTAAKSITLFAGLGILLFTYFLSKKVFTEKIAVLAVLLLITNHFFFFHSFLVEMDMLFSLLLLVSVYFLVKDDKLHNYFLAGSIAGISYIVKYGAYALFPIVILLALINISERGFKDSLIKLGAFFAAFFLFASPWLIHNAIENGSPFYSKHYINVAWGINRPRPMPFEYWDTYFELNTEYLSMKDVLMDKEKFIGNWLWNIKELPGNIYTVLYVIAYFLPVACLVLLKKFDRRRLILLLMAVSYSCLVTVAYTWERYLIPLIPAFCILISFCIYEVLPKKFSLKGLIKGIPFDIPLRSVVIAALILASIARSYGTVNEFFRPGSQELHEYKIAGEWLKGELTNEDWIMVPQPQFAWYAGTDKMVKYPRDKTLELADVVKKRKQNSFFFWHETLDNPIITDVDYVVYDRNWWKLLVSSEVSDRGLVVPDNFKEVFSTKGEMTHIIIYKITH